MRDLDLFKVDKEGVMMIGLPRISEVMVRILCKRTGRAPAEVISAALENLADKVLSPEDKEQLVAAIKSEIS